MVWYRGRFADLFKERNEFSAFIIYLYFVYIDMHKLLHENLSPVVLKVFCLG